MTTRWVGAPVQRVEDPVFLRGRGRYIDDVGPTDALHAAFLRSPHAHARIVRVDTAAAAALPGVHAVLTGQDLLDEKPFTTTVATRPECKTGTRRYLPVDRVRHVGEALAVVVARDRYVAEDALDLIEVDYELLPPVLDPEAALELGALLIHPDLGDNEFARITYANGDPGGAFARAPRVFRKRFHFGRVHAAPLEGRGVVADWDAVAGRCTIWTSTQMPHLVRDMLAGQYGLPVTALRVICPAVGGGFGLKVQLFPEEAIVPLLSRRLGRPVKWVEDRTEALSAGGHSKEVVMDLELATDEGGRFLGLRGRYVGDAGAWLAHPWTSLIDPLCAASFLPSMYDVQDLAYEVRTPFTNKCPSVAYRGVGWTSGQAAREILIDEAARTLGIDPVELRLRNAVPDATPYRSATGASYDGGSFQQSMRRAQELVGYEELRARQAALRAQGRYLGIGVSPFVEQGGWAARIAAVNGFPGLSYLDSATVSMEPDGTVVIASGFQDNGQGHFTTMAQLVADELQVPLDRIRVVQGDTDSVAYATGSWGSRTAVVAGGALIRASGDLRQKLLQLGAHLLEASPDDVELADGLVRVAGSPDRGVTVAQCATAAYWGPRPPGMDEPSLSATRSYDPPETFSNACVVAVVEVDAATGKVAIERLLVVEDCGTIVNPLVVDGQVSGAIAQAVGAVLLEGLPYEADGTFRGATLSDFLFPTATELPSVEVDHLETPSPVTEGGFKGMGEGGLIGGPSALVNAIADALVPLGAGSLVERTPLRPCDVLDLIDRGRAATAAGA